MPKMRYNSKTAAFLWILLALSLLVPLKLSAEFYKYLDKEGKLHFVDDQSNIPPEYRNNITVYKEKYDHLSEKEKVDNLKTDARKAEETRKRRAAEEKLLRKNELIKARQQQKIAKEKYLKRVQTKVAIDGNRVLVPVKLGYRGKEVEATLLLDTGATITTVHQHIETGIQRKRSRSYTPARHRGYDHNGASTHRRPIIYHPDKKG